MVKSYKLHKLAGLLGGIFLLILSISGFFLDHDKWSFLYKTTFKSVPSHILKAENRLFNVYYQDPENPVHLLVGGQRGLYESFDNGESFHKLSSLQILAAVDFDKKLYLATSDGVYIFNTKLHSFALKGKYITALSVSQEKIAAVVDKKEIVLLARKSAKVLQKNIVKIDTSQLQEDIKLSRFVRDLHYGRGLFDGDVSLLINDYGTLVLVYLALSGYMLWWLIHRKKKAKLSRKLIKTHANIFAIIALIPLFILAITGVFLDHSGGLAKFMKSVTIPHAVLPPVYDSLQSDIWSIDYDGKVCRVGNRYGVYASRDLQNWKLENRGFAYKMIRKGDTLYISGMGAPNRVLKNTHYSLLPNTPHMFKGVIESEKGISYFSTMDAAYTVPKFQNVTLYTLLLSLHDGSFFAPWWVWVNDFAAFGLVILGMTGLIRWYRKKRNVKFFNLFFVK